MSFFHGQAFAQRFSKNYSTKNGLANNVVYKIVQDNKGYIWCSTENGLSKFDGFNFENFNVWNGLSDNDNPIFKKDNFGNLWLFGFNGAVNVITKDSIVKIENVAQTMNKNLEVLSDSNCAFVFDKRGIQCFNKDLKLIKSFLWPQELMIMEFHAAFSDQQKGFYIIRNGSMFHFSKGKFQTLFNLEYPYKLKTNGFALGPNHFIYLSTIGIVEIKDGKAKILKRLDNGKTNVHPIFLKNKNDVYYSHKNELYRFNLLDTSVNEFVYKAKSTIIDLVIDKGGNLWIATHGAGVYCLKQKHELLKEEFVVNSENKVTRFLKDQESDYWFVYNNSTIAFNKGEQSFIVPPLKERSISLIKVFEINNNQLVIGDDIELMIINDLLAFKNAIIKYKQNVFKYYKDYNVLTGNVKDFESVNNRHIVSMGFAGIYEKYEKNWSRIYNKRTYAICNLDSNCFLASTDEGLKLFKEGKVLYWPQSKFLNQTFKQLYAISNSCILFVSSNEQLGIFDMKSNKVMLFRIGSMHRYLTYNSCIIQSKYKWFLCTNKGLLMIKANDRNLKCENDILNFEVIVDQEVHDLKTYNRMNYFLSNNRVFSFLHTVNQNINFNKIPLLLELNIEKDLNKITETSRSSFNYFENNIKCKIVDPSFSAETFRYRIPELNSNWNSVDENKFNLSNLNPGNYTIQIQSNGTNGKWSKAYIYTIAVIPRIIDASWFRIVIAVLILFIVLLTFSNIYNRRIESSNQKTKYGLSQLRALNVQMNPHFVVNALSSFQYLVYKEHKEKAIEYLHKFASLFSSILTNSEKQKISLFSELEQLENYIHIEQLRFEKKLDYLIEVDDNLKSNNIQLPPMFIQPFVENAIWHGLLSDKVENPFLLISFTLEKNYCKVEINDNGVGIKSKKKQTRIKEHDSTALKNILERIEIYNSINTKRIFLQILDKSEINEQGTLIILKFPQ